MARAGAPCEEGGGSLCAGVEAQRVSRLRAQRREESHRTRAWAPCGRTVGAPCEQRGQPVTRLKVTV